MHIPDNYLSPETCAAMTAAMVPVWAHSIRKVRQNVPKEKMPTLGVGAAFSFTGMMFNIPLPGGTTGHAVGGTLVSGFIGPEAACISITIALLLQALLFGDGGILAFGANCFNMAFVLPFVGYAAYRLLLRLKLKDTVAIAIGSYIGINASAFAAAVEFGIQPYLFTDSAGHALYCPYGLDISIPAMMLGHLTVFGLAEVIFTAAIYTFVRRTSPVHEADNSHCAVTSPATYVLLAILICAVPLGLIAAGTAWGEWEPSSIGIDADFSYASIFPDYSMAGLPDAAAYILSAVIGVSVSVIIFRIISSFMKSKADFS